MSSRRAQVALEYLTTYGWAILAVVIAIGALSYFGIMNPANLLPDKCDFGKQLDCADYQIKSNGELNIIFRNNFGKSINITSISWASGSLGSAVNTFPKTIESGKTGEFNLIMSPAKPKGAKADVTLTIQFKRSDLAGSPLHNISGVVFTMAQ
jgi:hypothetical protein